MVLLFRLCRDFEDETCLLKSMKVVILVGLLLVIEKETFL